MPGTVVGRALGKIILLGEHAVVYGAPALCGAIDAGVEFTAVEGEGIVWMPKRGRGPGGASGDTPYEPISLDHPGTLGQAYRAVLGRLAVHGRPIAHDFFARFDIPLGGGLGGSAAFSVGLTRALDRVLGLGLDAEALGAAAAAAEDVFHGRSSGLDHTLASSGGFGVFRPGLGFEPLSVPSIPLCIGWSGVERATRNQVARVAALFATDADGVTASVRRIRRLVALATRAVRVSDLEALGHAMNENQRELFALGVSCTELDALCQGALRAGAIGAKLTGGGGGGCVVALAPGSSEDVLGEWTRLGFSGFTTQVAGLAPGWSGGGLPAHEALGR
jgi:mevalonate kinase